jgi:nicotinamide-nucleotide amidase
VIEIANQIGAALKLKGWMIATAESCTGGGIAEAITAVPGCSAWFDRAFVTYSYEAKVEALGVQQSSLDEYGAVSEQVVREMAQGALGHSRAHVAIAVSGIAGPAGGTLEKPVGSVWIAWATRDSIDANGALNSKVISKRYLFSGDREDVRQQTVVKALAELLHNL